MSVSKILSEAVDNLNKLSVPQLKKEGVDMQMIIDVRDEIVALRRTYEEYRKGKHRMSA